MLKSDKRNRLKASVMALALTALPLAVQAAGLGKLTVYSALGQPLRAEIELSASREETSSLVARLASADAFKRAGIEYASMLSTIKIGLDKRANGQPFLKVSSDRPVNEPFVDMLVELNWASGRLVREYTFLLDPPDVFQKPAVVPAPPVALPETKAPPVPAPVAPPPQPVALPETPPAPAAPVEAPAAVVTTPPPAAAPAPAAPPAPSTASSGTIEPRSTTPAEPLAPKKTETPKADEKPRAGDQTRAVKKGDTLAKIASETKVDSISLDQMLVALWRSNKEAFDGGNMNRLRAGKILSIPDKEAAAAIERTEARKLVVAQSADFNAYRRKLAGAVAAEPAVRDEGPKQAASGKIAPKVEDKVPAAPVGKDRLEVSRTEAGKGGKAGDKNVSGRISALEEEVVARERAIREANERVAALEKNLADLKRLAELKSQAGVALQQQAQAAKAGPAPVPPPVPAAPPVEAKKPEPAAVKPVEAPKPAVAPVPAKPAEAPAKPTLAVPPLPAPTTTAPPAKPVEATKAADAAKPAEAPKPADAAAKPADIPAPGATTPKPGEPAAAAPVATATADKPGEPPAAAAPKPKPAVKLPPPPPPPPPSFTEENPELVFGGGGLIALLLGYFGFKAWRKKRDEAVIDALAEESAHSGVVASNVESTAGESIDTGAALPTDFSQVDLTDVGGDEGVDPVQEADVYMAYGRDTQAEEILLEALKTEPARQAIHMKLLEIYTARKAPQQFAAIATDLYALTGGQGSEWSLAAEMGRSIDPNNPLYGGSSPEAVAIEQAAATVIVPAAALDPGQAAEMSAVRVEPAAAESMAPVAAEEVATSLDFDLDLGEPEPASAAGVAAAVPAEDSMTLDFDLNLDAPTEPVPAPQADAPAAAEGAILDFDLGIAEAPPAAQAAAPEPLPETIDLGEPEAVAPEPAAPMAEAKPAAIELPETELPDIDLPVEPVPEPAAQPAAQPAAAMPAMDFDFDLSLPEVAAEAPAAPVVPTVAETEASPPLEFSSISLELDEPSSAADVELPDMPAAATDEASASDNPEVATKLELAQAYEEMGDKEGARELLNEVVSEGSPAQQEMARNKLTQLG